MTSTLVLALASCHSASASPATAPTPGLLVIAEKPACIDDHIHGDVFMCTEPDKDSSPLVFR